MPGWFRLRHIVVQLYDLGFLPDGDKFYFCHMDLMVRNVMVDVTDDTTVHLTGILDWDAEFACFVPKFVAYRAPLDL